MKHLYVKIILLILYCFPYVYLAMDADLRKKSTLLYGIIIFCFLVYSIILRKIKNIQVLIIGNILSYLSSYYFISINETEKWSWYFKPFTSTGLLILISVILFTFQLIVILYTGSKKLKKDVSN